MKQRELTYLKPADLTASSGYREHLGDLDELADSIRDVGLSHPIVLRPDGKTVIMGRRRLAACVKLGMLRVPCIIAADLDDAIKWLKAEHDENHCRRDLTPSEKVRLAADLRELEAPKAAARKAATQAKPGNDGKAPTGPGKLPGPENVQDSGGAGETREKVAEAVGMSPKTLAKAEEVVKAAEENPEVFEPIKQQMDATGKVDPAHREMKAKQAEEEPPADPLKAASDAMCREMNVMVRTLDELHRKAEELSKQPLGITTHWNSLMQQIKNARGAIQIGRPKHGCPWCKATGTAKKKPCEACKGLAYVNRSSHKRGCEAMGTDAGGEE